MTQIKTVKDPTNEPRLRFDIPSLLFPDDSIITFYQQTSNPQA
jgi:hypothetical protein